MGVCELIPGVSSGTMALLLGIYDQLLGAISKVVSKDLKKAVLFLLPLVIGMGVAIVTMSSLMTYLLESHTVPTHFFFLGMVLGVVPMILKLSNWKAEFKTAHYMLAGISIVLVFVLSILQEPSSVSDVEVSFGQMIFLFFVGMIGAAVTLLPGISGSLVMLILGAYPTIIYSINAFTSFDFSVTPLLMATGLGILAGVLGASKVIAYLLRHYPYLIYAAITGLLIGSVFPIFPGLPADGLTWVISLFTFAAGLILSLYMGSKNKETK